MNFRSGRWGLIPVFAFASCRAAVPVVDMDAAIVHVNVIPMTSDTVLANRTVLVRNGAIADIVPDGTVGLGERTQAIDGEGRYLMPGFVDGHAHLRARGVMDIFLSQGFTTIRNMHGGFGDPLVWQRAIEAGEFVGPTLINASPILAWDTEGFTLPGRGPITSLDTLKQFVREIADSGYASVKTLKFPRAAFDTLMAEANRVGLPVSGHLPITETGDPTEDLTLNEVLNSGMLAVEHVGELITFGLEPEVSDTVASADLALRVARSGIAVTTTTGITRIIASALELDSAYVTQEMYDRAVKYAAEEDAAFLYQLPEIWRQNGFRRVDPKFLAIFVRQLHGAGVPLIVGTDAHTAHAYAGESAVEEMLFLNASGLTPFEALAAMTSTPAKVLGERGKWGTIEVGARADLVLLDGDPLADPAAVRSVTGVMVRGRWLDRSQLTTMRAEAEQQKLMCRRPRCD